jgi:hypothetical protein
MICIKKNKLRYLQTEIHKRSYSSAGSEHLPYKQGVLGSNPSGTTETTSNEVVFVFYVGVEEWVVREEFLKILVFHLKLNKLPNTELMNLTNLYRFRIRIVI